MTRLEEERDEALRQMHEVNQRYVKALGQIAKLLDYLEQIRAAAMPMGYDRGHVGIERLATEAIQEGTK